MINNNMTSKEIVEYIIKLDSNSKKNILKDINTRNIIFNSNNHYAFVWLIQELKDEEILYLLDNSSVDILINDIRFFDKLNAIMTSGNKYIDQFISNDVILKKIIDNIDKIYMLEINFNSCGDLFANKFLNYLLDNNLYDYFKYLGLFNKNVQNNLFTIDNISKIFKIKNLSYSFVLNLNEDVIMKLMKFDNFKSKFLKFSIEDINYIVNKPNFKFQTEFIKSNDLIIKYLKIENPNKYITSVNLLESNNLDLYNIISEKKKIWLDKQVKNKLLDKDTLIQNMIVIYFKDVYQNFLINLKTILEFNLKLSTSLISTSRLGIYNKIINYKNLDYEDIYNLYCELDKNESCSKMFYEDFNSCKRYCINMYNNNFLNPNNSQELYNSKLSDECGVNVYYLDGESFLGCIHTTGYQYSDELRWMPDKKKTISLSIIGDNNITRYNEKYNYITFGFSSIDSNKIMHISNTDSFTSKYGTTKIYRIYTPDDLLENSVGYNEILYKENNDKFYPNYIVSFDKITDEEINTSKKFNIPIVLINSKKYGKKQGLESMSENSYYR